MTSRAAAGDTWAAASAGARAAAARAARRGPRPVEVALVLGDLHAEHLALGHALAHFGGAVDAVLSVGDVVDGDPARCDAQRTVDLLVEAGAVGVAGNHDRWWLGGGADLPDATPQGAVRGRALDWLRALPRWRWVQTAAGRAALAHGFGDDDMARVYPETSPAWAHRHRTWPALAAGGAKFHLGGHTHQHFVQALPGDVSGPPLTLINAGTLQRGRGRPVVACVDFLHRVARFYAVLPGGAPAASPEVTATF